MRFFLFLLRVLHLLLTLFLSQLSAGVDVLVFTETSQFQMQLAPETIFIRKAQTVNYPYFVPDISLMRICCYRNIVS